MFFPLAVLYNPKDAISCSPHFVNKFSYDTIKKYINENSGKYNHRQSTYLYIYVEFQNIEIRTSK